MIMRFRDLCSISALTTILRGDQPPRSAVLVLLALPILGMLFASPAAAVVQSVDLSFSGEILGGDNPLYTVNSSANFSWDDACNGTDPAFCTLTITLSADPSLDGAAPSQGEVLGALVFDVLGGADFRDGPPGNTPFGGTVTASALEGADAATALGEIGLDVSRHWGLNPAISVLGHGSHALSSVGDLFNGAATVGSGQTFAGPLSSVEPTPPNGAAFGIIDSGSSSGGSGWGSVGTQAFVQDEIVAQLFYIGSLSGVENVEPLYGTMGLPIPEPGTALLIGLGLIGLASNKRRS
jgi:hypothetical protein